MAQRRIESRLTTQCELLVTKVQAVCPRRRLLVDSRCPLTSTGAAEFLEQWRKERADWDIEGWEPTLCKQKKA